MTSTTFTWIAAITFLWAVSCSSQTSDSRDSTENLSSNVKDIPTKSTTKKVTLIQLPSDGDRLRFALSNGLENSIFLAYSETINDDEKTLFMSYFLECKAEQEGKYVSAGPEFHFVPRLTALKSGKEIIFRLETPQYSECRISVGYYENEVAATLVNEKLMRLPESEAKLVDESLRKVALGFTIER